MLQLNINKVISYLPTQRKARKEMADYYFEETVIKRYCITAESEDEARMMVGWQHQYEEKSKDWELVEVVE